MNNSKRLNAERDALKQAFLDRKVGGDGATRGMTMKFMTAIRQVSDRTIRRWTARFVIRDGIPITYKRIPGTPGYEHFVAGSEADIEEADSRDRKAIGSYQDRVDYRKAAVVRPVPVAPVPQPEPAQGDNGKVKV